MLELSPAPASKNNMPANVEKSSTKGTGPIRAEVVDTFNPQTPKYLKYMYDHNVKMRDMSNEIVDEFRAEGDLVNAGHASKRASDYEVRRRAKLWDAHEDLRAHEGAYKQMAIQDATQAGHDINYGGVHYPAQKPEQLTERQ